MSMGSRQARPLQRLDIASLVQQARERRAKPATHAVGAELASTRFPLFSGNFHVDYANIHEVKNDGEFYASSDVSDQCRC